MHDVLSLVTGDMSRHVVEVKLPGQEASSPLVLIEVGAKAKMVDVLAETYGDEFTDFHRKLAEKIYGTKEDDLVFGVFFKDQEMVFAFSRYLADYGQGTKTVNFKDLDEVLVEKIPSDSTAPSPPGSPVPVRPRPPLGGGSMVVIYALVEKPTQS
jgi:hypothetical protein